jgi:hypothetical protein
MLFEKARFVGYEWIFFEWVNFPSVPISPRLSFPSEERKKRRSREKPYA